MNTNHVFKRQSKEVKSLPILQTIRNLRPTSGEVGLEIECEGNKFSKDPPYVVKPWKYVKDGSLRGHDNAEYIFKEPLKFEEVEPAVRDLWDMFKRDGTILDESNRTSVHVHMNAQNFYINRLCSFLALYICVEDILTEWCGDHRVGNLFCLRTSDAPAILTTLKSFFRDGGHSSIPDHYHYAGLNASALFKFGSIEIRSLRGCTDPETIIQWVKILERIYKLSADFEDPRDVCTGFSGEGAFGFLQTILGDNYNAVRSGISYTDQEIFDSMLEGVRRAQEICYCRDWSYLVKVDPTSDPFGRRILDSEQPLYNSSLTAAMSILSSATAPSPTPGWVLPTYQPSDDDLDDLDDFVDDDYYESDEA